MIQPGTMLKVADNTGVKLIKCFNIPKGTKHRYAQIGDIIVASVKKVEPRKKIKKKDIVRAVIVRQKKPFEIKKTGIYIRFDENAAVILDAKTKKPRGTKVSGPIPRILKEMGFEEIVNIAEEIV